MDKLIAHSFKPGETVNFKAVALEMCMLLLEIPEIEISEIVKSEDGRMSALLVKASFEMAAKTKARVDYLSDIVESLL